MDEAGAVLHMAEVAFGEREFAMDHVALHKVLAKAPVIQNELEANCRHDDPRRGQHKFYQLRTKSEIWLKENVLNYIVARLPSDWKYFAWIDADTWFLRPNFVGECIQQLQHYDFIQMFTTAQDLGPDYSVISSRPGFVHEYMSGRSMDAGYYYQKPGKWGMFSGLAWACTRRAWDAVGGLPDYCIHGGGDWHLAWALIGQVDKSVRHDLHPGYLNRLKAFEARCEKSIRRNIGCMTGTVAHMFHGRKADRKYADRHELLAITQFNPDTDLQYDSQGIYKLVDDGSDRFLWLRDGLRMYNRERNEDANEA